MYDHNGRIQKEEEVNFIIESFSRIKNRKKVVRIGVHQIKCSG